MTFARPTTSAVSVPMTDSDRDFDAARLELLRRRVVIMVCVVGVVLIGLTMLAQLALRGAIGVKRVSSLAPALGGVAVINAAQTKVRRVRGQLPLRSIVNRSTALVTVAIIMLVPASHVVADGIEQGMQRAGFRHVQIGALAPALVGMLCVHFAASVIVPWSLRESARPVAIVLAVAAVGVFFAPEPWPARFGGLAALALMGAPGMLVCWLRYSRLRQRFQLTFLAGRVSEVQRDLAYARRIHEKVFPRPITAGPVRFDFRYEPMRQIGGDFVDVIRDDGGAVIVVLVDVTGHGIAAALAVNRLHGEIKRALAHQSGASPAALIGALNEYVNLTLADENVFATALVIRIEPGSRTVRYANAGHPPALLCRAGAGAANGDGSIEALDSTSMLRGPLPAEEYEAVERSFELGRGDELIAYTDGATECRDRSDNQLGLDGLRGLVARSRALPAGVRLDAIVMDSARYRLGPPDDDTLVLSVSLADDLEVGARATHDRAAPAAAETRRSGHEHQHVRE